MTMTAATALPMIETIERQLRKGKQHLLAALPPNSPPPSMYTNQAAAQARLAELDAERAALARIASPTTPATALPVGNVVRLTAEGGASVLVLVQDGGVLKQLPEATPPAAAGTAGAAGMDPAASPNIMAAEDARNAAEEAAARAWFTDAISGLQQVTAA